MKQLELTVLARDVDGVIEFLGRRALMHLSGENAAARPPDEGACKGIRENLNRLEAAARSLGLGELPVEPGEESRLPGEAEDALAAHITGTVSSLAKAEDEGRQEKRKVEEALSEAKAFSGLNAPFSDLDQLSYLTLRVGRLDPRRQSDIRKNLADRAVIIPLGTGETGDRVLAAASRKGRFALDSELKQADFVPISIPGDYKGVPVELLSGLEDRLRGVEKELAELEKRKEGLREDYGKKIMALTESYLLAGIVEQLKARLRATKSVFFLSGWVPSGMVNSMAEELERLTGGRIGIRAWDPEELPAIREGREKVPVSLDHGAFVKGFEGLVFSYGAPLYGTIDPTFLVAIFFTVLFGIMFGDLGQGFVLLAAGLLCGRKGLRFLRRFGKFSVPLIAVGVSSMIMGLLNGEVFTHEELLVGPTRALTAFLTGRPMDRILTLMPLPEKGGSVVKLFYFFGFTLAVGVLLNSAGLIVNIVNQLGAKKYEKAVFSKTGMAGALLFWYAIFMALRSVISLAAREPIRFCWYDPPALLLPAAGIFFGPGLWRLVTGERPVFPEGLMVFIVEGFVELLETASTYVSNTVSFLRVGAFALSHAVLSYIVFYFSEEVSRASAGTAFALLILVFGNGVIILLEGMIVAIQVIRLQYYEFFSKFFTETGVVFAPFRLRQEEKQRESPP
jgi:V/A-type H+-transporting ATPase subunit I